MELNESEEKQKVEVDVMKEQISLGTLFSYFPFSKGLVVTGDKLICRRSNSEEPCSNNHICDNKIYRVRSHVSSRAIGVAGAVSFSQNNKLVYCWTKILREKLKLFSRKKIDSDILKEIKTLMLEEVTKRTTETHVPEYFVVYIFDAFYPGMSSLGQFGLGRLPKFKNQNIVPRTVQEGVKEYNVNGQVIFPEPLGDISAYEEWSRHHPDEVKQNLDYIKKEPRKNFSNIPKNKGIETTEGIIKAVARYSPYPTSCIGQEVQTVILKYKRNWFF